MCSSGKVFMRYQYRFAIGLLVSAALHAAVLGKYWSSDWFVQTPEVKTTVFRVKVLQPIVPAPKQLATEASMAASLPVTIPDKPKSEKKVAPKPKVVKHKRRPKPEKAHKQPTKPARKARSEKRIAAQSSQARQAASAGRIANLEDQYRAQVRREIEKHKFYPARARRQRRQGTVTVAFSLARNGQPGELRLTRQCSSAVLNRAALEAVRKVGTFPPFPAEIHRLSWAFEIPLSYRIR